ncbi:MAG TPA: hypothetical protein GXX28_10695 [Firmicutes bacterium]|nr:hypothetical protein [Bacillota bacterium]
MGLLGGALALAMAYVPGGSPGPGVTAKAEEIARTLPGMNCGACGYRGCRECAVAIASGEASCSACPAGGAAMAEAVAGLLRDRPGPA